MCPLSMMHWSSLSSPIQGHPTVQGPALPASDIWWLRLETCSKLFTWWTPASNIWWSETEDLPKRVPLRTPPPQSWHLMVFYWSTYVGGTRPTVKLSWFYLLFSLVISVSYQLPIISNHFSLVQWTGSIMAHFHQRRDIRIWIHGTEIHS